MDENMKTPKIKKISRKVSTRTPKTEWRIFTAVTIGTPDEEHSKAEAKKIVSALKLLFPNETHYAKREVEDTIT